MAETFQFSCSGSATAAVLCEIGTTAVQCLTEGGCTWENFIQEFLDPYDLWFSRVFQGRPKVGPHSATDCDALFLIPSSNPLISQWGIGIRLLEAQGCPVSASGGPCRTGFNRLATAALTDLHRQFGPATGSNLWAGYSKTFVARNPCSSKVAIAGRVVLDQYYVRAVRSGLLDPKTGFPPVAGKPKCPPGFHFDPKTERCVADPKQVCPPGTIGIPPLCKPITRKPVPPRGGCNCGGTYG